MTNRTPKSQAPATAKKAAKKAPAAKRYLMPQVDLGGLGGGDNDDDLPPLDLGQFDQGEKPRDPAVQQAADQPRQEAPTSPAVRPVDEHTRPIEAAPAPADAPLAAQSAASAPARTQDTRTTPQTTETVPPTASASSAEETTPSRSSVPSPAPAPDVLTEAVAQSASATSAPAEGHGGAEVRNERPYARPQATSVDPPQPVSSEPSGAIGVAAPATRDSDSSAPALWNAGENRSTTPWRPASGRPATPARRPRRTPSRPFTAQESHQRRDDRLRELVDRAPRYAALLQSYAVAQSGKESYQNRNVQLYGLTAQELLDRITIDKAVVTAGNLPTPRFTPAHYIDATLDHALSGLDPQGTDIQRMEAERDVVWELAQDGLAYRDYISADPEIAALKKSRSQCPLRTRVNQRYSRMMDILRTMPDLKAQPFEIASACVAKYLEGLQAEQPAFEEFWTSNLESSYE
ncbi:hypothetical protein [Streptomyces sp. NRRL S-813]|uniref:hypothetical protein n=1 Tax=Streptomyces sp. NRRL S-813 TaxID=1463919 RepID=UPI00131CFAA3|nr:hypothetical protein [Streptomyces sp. NRRL S-813]